MLEVDVDGVELRMKKLERFKSDVFNFVSAGFKPWLFCNQKRPQT